VGIAIFDARTAGNRPPRKPITAAKSRPSSINAGVIKNEKESIEKLCQFIVEVIWLLMGRIRSMPTTPPINAINTDSVTKEIMMCLAWKPRALSVAISIDLALTAEYIVFIAPNIAPMAMREVTRKPSTLMSIATRHLPRSGGLLPIERHSAIVYRSG
jgi:hypothetical protein